MGGCLARGPRPAARHEQPDPELAALSPQPKHRPKLRDLCRAEEWAQSEPKASQNTDWPGRLQGAEGGRARPHPVSHHPRGSLQPGRSLNLTGFREPEAEGGCGTNDLRHDNQASLRPHPNRSRRGASIGADRRYHAAQPGPFCARRARRGAWTAQGRVAGRLLERADGPLPRSRSRRLHRLMR